MPRDLPVSNGNLLVNFDLQYRIRDIYFPRVGEENHTLGHEFRFGIWVDGAFSWMGPEWEKDLRYQDDSLVTDVRLSHAALQLEIRCHDTVDSQHNIYLKQVSVTDLGGRERDVRLFFTHDFSLYGHDVGDTAFYDPHTGAIVHYKLERYFLANCRSDASGAPAEYSCGLKGHESRASWRDAERGKLNSNPISWGPAESTVGVRLALAPGATETCSYWLAAGKTYDEVAALNAEVVEQSTAGLLERTAKYWQAWVRKEPRTFADLPRSVTDIFDRSLLILRSQIDNGGAIIAANDSDMVRFGGDTYSYMWGRDGAFIAAALAKAGYSELCRPFFRFCARVMTREGYLLQHYNPDGTLASNWHPWVVNGEPVLPIQEDSTALLLWSLWIDYEMSRDIEFIRPLYENFILRSADFLLTHRDEETGLPKPSYDLWEERFGVHTYTVATVVAGLRAAANFAGVFQDAERVATFRAAADEMTTAIRTHLYDEGLQRYARSGYRTPEGYLLDAVIDVSLLGLVTFGVLPLSDARVLATVQAIRDELTCETDAGGLARYRSDVYQLESDVPAGVPGNPWFVSTLWLAEVDILNATSREELRAAIPFLEWCARHALPSGVLAEQLHPVTGAPLSVSPLTWSHSALIWAVLAYVERFDALG